MRSKKAFIFYSPILVFIAFIILITALVTLQGKAQNMGSKSIGSQSSDFFVGSWISQYMLNNIDTIGKVTAWQTINEFGSRGGSIDPLCGIYNSLPVYNGKDECFPDYLSEYEKLFNRKISDNLKTFNSHDLNFFEQMPLAKYKLSSKDNVLIGVTDTDLITDQGQFKPNFAVDIYYPFEDYLEVEKWIKGVVARCSPESDKTLEPCIKAFSFNGQSPKLESCTNLDITDDEPRHFIICLENPNYRFPVIGAGSQVFQNPFYQFAINLERQVPIELLKFTISPDKSVFNPGEEIVVEGILSSPIPEKTELEFCLDSECKPITAKSQDPDAKEKINFILKTNMPSEEIQRIQAVINYRLPDTYWIDAPEKHTLQTLAQP